MATRVPVIVERTYRARVEELWSLWTKTELLSRHRGLDCPTRMNVLAVLALALSIGTPIPRRPTGATSF